MSVDPNSPVVLLSVPTEIEADVIANALCEQGVKASTSGGFTAGFIAEAPGDVAIIVPSAELDQARQVLATIQQEDSQIDWSKIDVGTPEE